MKPACNCPGCRSFVKQTDQGVVCFSCNAYWHYKCANVTDADIEGLADQEFYCIEHRIGRKTIEESKIVPYIINNKTLKKKLLRNIEECFDPDKDIQMKDKGKQYTINLNLTTYIMATGGVLGQKNMLILFERFHHCGVNTFYGMSKFYSVQKLLALQCVVPLTFP